MAANKSKEREERAKIVEQRKREAARKERRVRLLTWGSIGLVIALIAGAAVVVLGDAAREQSRIQEAAQQPIEGKVEIPIESALHIPNLPNPEPVDGVVLPPAGGDHDAVWQNCGIYDEPIRATHAIHSLEHGAVWVTYHPDLEAADVAVLENKLANRAYTLLSPMPDLASPVVLTAWGLQLELDDVNDERIDVFLTKYVQGPQTPEPGAACSGGIGNPR